MILDQRFELLEPVPLDDQIHHLAGVDRHAAADVVVSTVSLSGLTASARRKLEEEAQRLRVIESPCLPRVLAVGGDVDVFWVVAERVSGTTLRSRLARMGPLDVDDATAVGSSILRGLADLHAAGLLHGGVRPENVIVSGVEALDRVTLVGRDFPASLGRTPPLAVAHARIAYLSPEQAGVLRSPVDERSDVYSAGVVLFEALAGRPPFTAQGLGEALRQHLTASLPRFSELGIDVPPPLEDVVSQMLAKEPGERYPSAGDALADLEAVRGILGGKDRVRPLALNVRSPSRALNEPVLVGRQEELGQLEQRLELARDGRGGLVLLAGESGSGKTRLLDELAIGAEAAGGWVVRGRVDAGPQRPLDLLAAAAADVVAGARARPERRLRLQQRVEHVRDRVVRALPLLAEVLGAAPAPEPVASGFLEEDLTLDALAAFLDALGSPDEPALVLLDDCQWSDDVTNRLLVSWRDRHREDRHVFIVVAYRTEEVAAGHPLDAVGDRVHLAPLDGREVRALAESMAGLVPEAAIETVVRLAGGSPFMAQAVLRGLIESGALLPSAEGWSVDAGVLDRVQASSAMAAALTRRLELLPPDALHLLSVAAVIGREFDVDLASRLAGLTDDDTRAGLLEATRRHMVWVTSGRAAFVHDRLREAFLDRLDDENRRSLHRELALELESRAGVSAFDVAYHFDAGGAPDRALPFALDAARQARAQYALALAEQLYRIAERGVAPSDLVSRRELSEGLGEVLMLRGNYAEASRCFQQALPLLEGQPEATGRESHLETARLEGQLGELAFKQDKVGEASEWFQRGLRLLGYSVPGGRLAVIFHIVREVLVQLAHRIIPPTRRRAPASDAARDLLAAHLHCRLGFAWWLEGGGPRLFWASLRHLNLTERHPPSEELGQAYATTGVALAATWPRLVPLGIRFLERSLAVRRQLGNLWGEGQALHFQGVVLHAGGRYAEAITRFDEAVALLERTGDRWELNTARWHRALCRYRLGQLTTAIDEAKSVFTDAHSIGDVEASGVAVEVWAKASAGALPAEVTAEAIAGREGVESDVQTTVAVLQAEAVRLLRLDRFGEAVGRLDEAARLVASVRVRNVYVASVAVWRATALRRAVEAGVVPAGQSHTAALRSADRAARHALRVARRYRNDLPHALREAGLTAAMRARLRRARRLLDRSVTMAEDQDARHELAVSLRARGDLGRRLGWDGSAADTLRAGELFGGTSEVLTWGVAEAAPGPTLSLADRFEGLLGAGREVTAPTTPRGIMAATREAVLSLLRAEDCVVVDLAGTPGRRHPNGSTSGSPGPPPDAIRRAVEAQRPVIPDVVPAEDGRPGTAGDQEARSAICLPILVHQEPVACLYARHTRVAGLFGPEEVRLAAFIASLAGAALEREQLRHDTTIRTVEAQEAERARVARDLHDQVGQGLTSVLLTLQFLEDSLHAGAVDDAIARSEGLRELLSDVLQDVRSIAFELRPTLLDDLGLSAALRRLIRDVSGRHDLTVDLAVNGLDARRLPPEIETTAYRVTQEALTNVVRHSQARRCAVVVEAADDNLAVAISDDGCGFDPSVVSTESLGLRNMAERAELVGGTLTFSSSSRGTMVTLDVPLP
ncbi:MAG: AAA family ATPase [Actinomycetota bacterium]